MSIIFTVMSYGGLALAVVCLVVVVILFIKWDIPKILGEITGSTQKKAIEKIRKEGYESDSSKRTSIKSSSDSGAIKARKTNTDELTSSHTGRTSELPQGKMTQSTDSTRRGGLTAQENVTNTVFHVYQSGEETTVLGSVAGEQTTVLGSGVGNEAGEQTTVLGSEVGNAAEEETTVLGLEAGNAVEEEATVLGSEVGNAVEEETTVLGSEAGNAAEEETTVLGSGIGNAAEEETTVLNSGAGLNPEEQTTILSATAMEDIAMLSPNGTDEVIHIPNEVYTQPGTIRKVLDLVVTHTDEVIV